MQEQPEVVIGGGLALRSATNILLAPWGRRDTRAGAAGLTRGEILAAPRSLHPLRVAGVLLQDERYESRF